MVLTVKHFDIRSTNSVDALIEEKILGLEGRMKIEEARVRLERRREGSPRFRVALHLVTPGPDLLAEGQDHTLRAAIDKVMVEVDRKLAVRGQRRVRRVRSNVQEPAEARLSPIYRSSGRRLE